MAAPDAHPLARLLREAAAGRPPRADGAVEVLASPPGPSDAVVSFTAHAVVAASVEPGWVSARLDPSDLSAPLLPPFLTALADRLGVPGGNLDVVLAATGRGAGLPSWLVEGGGEDHARVARAERYRRDTRVYADREGAAVLILGRGLAGRLEGSFEVDAHARGRRLGRRLVAAAVDLAPAGEPLFLQVAPGNAASLRACLAAGARPIGAEVLFLRR